MAESTLNKQSCRALVLSSCLLRDLADIRILVTQQTTARSLRLNWEEAKHVSNPQEPGIEACVDAVPLCRHPRAAAI